MSPYASVWRRQYPAAAIPFKQLARILKPLVDAHPPERIVAELAGFLAKTEPRYLNLAKFAATFGTWSTRQDNSPPSTCLHHADRPAVATVSRVPLCRQCFEAP